MRIAETRFAAIDFESAGSAPGRTDAPVQIAIAHLSGNAISEALCSYVKPGTPVTWAARKVHGITDSMIEDAPLFLDLWPRIKSDMEGCWIVAHGAATEKRFLRVFPFHSFGPWVDTLDLARAAYPNLSSHALGEVIRALGLERAPEIQAEGFRWHDARCDAIASLVLLRHLISVCGLADAETEVLKTAGLGLYFKNRSDKSRKG
ncbi:MAG: 3'-5' exonuclease [Terrimicrobiaceae bacterium]